jgi:hypothetical protein
VFGRCRRRHAPCSGAGHDDEDALRDDGGAARRGHGGGLPREGAGRAGGEKIDRTLERMEDAVDPKGPAEKAGRALDRAAEDLKD